MGTENHGLASQPRAPLDESSESGCWSIPRKKGVMSGTIAAKKVVTHPYVVLVCVLCLFFVLPRYGSMAVMVGCASILSAYVAVLPEHFRSRSGSMMTAICLVAGMWLEAAVITALTLMGAIRG
jgi:hypothetical protein